MLISRNLDDQSFEEILEEARGRLPWICPVWTDHNEHDPGITILELMAWFKETQQFQMNQVTPGINRRLLKLAGGRLRPASPAVCAVKPDPEAPGYPVRSRLISPQGVAFELTEAIPEGRPQLVRMRIERAQQKSPAELPVNVQGSTAFAPFDFASLIRSSRFPASTI